MASVNVSVLENYREQGLLKRAAHPELPLLIWNYADVCQWKSKWDPITNLCRGLVTDVEGNIVGRSFEKFHNIEDSRHTATEEFVLYEKLDGSLALLFYFDDKWIITSRGSFTSPQAVKAQELLQKYDLSQLDKGTSYTFELIYPANRIVVYYGEREELVYLASFQKDGTERFDGELMQNAGFPVVKTIDNVHFSAFKALEWSNAEGAVVRFSNGSRAKIKFEKYKELHHAASNVTVYGVWDWFKKGKSVEELAPLIPDEAHAWLKGLWKDFTAQYEKLKEEIHMKWVELEVGDVKSQRGKFAQAVKDDPLRSMLFAKLDGKQQKLHEMLCDAMKPRQ